MHVSKRASATLLGTLAAVLAGIVVFDVYEDWLIQSTTLWLTLLENVAPFLLASSLVVVTYWLYQNRGERFVTIVARWTLLGSVSLFLIGGYGLLLQQLEGQIKPFILLTHTVIVGSCAGVLIGYHVAQVRQTRRELERSNEQLEQFASVVSHDLRNPLQVARGQLGVARDTDDAEHFETAEDALDRMDTMIEDVLTLVRADRTVDDTAVVDLESVARDSWATVATDDGTLAVLDTATVRADDALLRQVFENCFGNAVMHGGSGTTVHVGTLPDGFYVEDDGPGVPPEERKEVFETGYSTSEDGTGFGLSIVADVAEAHDWDVTVTDGSMGGARFEVTDVDSLDACR